MIVLKKRDVGEYIGFVRRTPVLIALLCVAAVSAFVWFSPFSPTTYTADLPAADETPRETEPPVAHLPTPEPLKAVYMSACVAGTPSLRAALVALIDETELNAVVIDVKDYSGYLSFVPADAALQSVVSVRCRAPDMKEFLKTLHDKGVYTIGRITVFQDPVLTKTRPDLAVRRASDGGTWKDYKGLSFTDPGSHEVWDYIVSIAKASYTIGFDELNFDYIRFPSDGPMSDIAFSWSGARAKAEVLEEFFVYLSNQVRPIGAALSADLFGMTTTNTDDLNIGQVLERAEPYFDYLSPMVYPSHYPPHFLGMDNPNHYPYEVVKYSMDSAVKRFLATTTSVALRGLSPIATTTKPSLYPKPVQEIRKLRPWLQDFDYGGNYDIAEVKAQIQATYDAGLTSWMLWAPSNKYTRGALLPTGSP